MATVQLARGASVLPATHWEVVAAKEKSGEAAMLVILAGAVLLWFVRRTNWGILVIPTSTVRNTRYVCDKVTGLSTPLP